MSSTRGLLLVVLSVFCLAALLYYTVLPQGPLLLHSIPNRLHASPAPEIMIQADKFTPEWVVDHGRPAQEALM